MAETGRPLLVPSWPIWRPSTGAQPQPRPTLQKVPYLCRSLVRVPPEHFRTDRFHSWSLDASFSLKKS